MILRDARGIKHPNEPYRSFKPSLMRMVGTSGQTGEGGWKDMSEGKFFAKMPTERTYTWKPTYVQADVPCAGCGNKFLTARPDSAIYCGNKCRNREAKRKQRQRELSARRTGNADAQALAPSAS